MEERLAQKSCRKRGRSHSRSGTRDSRSPNSRERHPRKRSRSKEWKRSPSPCRRRSPSSWQRRSPFPRRRRSTTPRRIRTPNYHDDGWEQGIMGRTPFAPHILRIRFPRTFLKPTDMGYCNTPKPINQVANMFDQFQSATNRYKPTHTGRYLTLGEARHSTIPNQLAQVIKC
ncbi:hypothetical protein PIB30_066415 [Stylosanthes scabra]|uniref:Uncharacterized protein n=1 Tax=Stylosanthes scabra TaxID=79078 RepID=A0ABU6RM73_9FABA|nr:hypothetical protein [Stylosanthes scabra]